MDLSAPSRLQAWRSRSERPWDATSRFGLTFLCAALYLGLGLKYPHFLTADNFFITLLSAASIRVAAFVISGGFSVYGFPGRFVHLGQTYFGPVPLPVVIGGIVFLIVSIALLRTVAGLRTYAIGGNANAARLSGIDVDRYVTGLFAMNGTLIGLVSVMTVARLGSASPTVGVGFELDVLTAAILGGVSFAGGLGHPFGVFVGWL